MMRLPCLLLAVMVVPSWGILYPRDSPTRASKSLDGVWHFKTSPKMEPDLGFTESWYSIPLERTGEVIDMPVPSSYNDITTTAELRDYVGWVWYGRSFLVSPHWEQERIWLRFGSVHYTAIVYVNGFLAGNHSGGHLPFEMDVSGIVSFTQENWITVACNNTLNRFTVPQGEYVWRSESDQYPPGYSTLEIGFDFFNYAGIHRPVILHTTPRDIQITDLTTSSAVREDLSLADLTVSVAYTAGDPLLPVTCSFSLVDNMGQQVASVVQPSCDTTQLSVADPQLWWPYLMSDTPGYLYTLRISVESDVGQDIYTLPVGLREVTWGNSSFHINHSPFYFRGFGRHEDSDFRGKGLDLPLVLRDHNLIRWLGANSYRTSHYPYADEIMDMADRHGIVIIDECPAVALDHFEPALLDNHLQTITELVNRDKNHPSVVMWSAGNEPKSDKSASDEYFKAVYDHTRQLDSTRPVTLVVHLNVEKELASKHFDVIGINRYYGWYDNYGHTEVIEQKLTENILQWRTTRGKLVMVTEYGADTISGLHEVPSLQFSEEYQVDLMTENFKSFDKYRHESWFIGEMIWNFADFATKQEVKRVAGNKKGIFTRDRKPKLGAHVLRGRYWQLAQNDRAQKKIFN